MPEGYEYDEIETPGQRLLDLSEGFLLVQSFESAAIELKRITGDDELGIMVTFMARANKTDEWLTVTYVIGREMVDSLTDGLMHARTVIEEAEQ